MRLSRAQLWALGGAATGISLAVIPLLAVADVARDRGLWIGVHVAVTAGFFGTGLFAWYRRPDKRIGALMVATGFAWCLGILMQTDPPPLFWVGTLMHSLFIAVAIHLLLAFPEGRLSTAVDRVLVTASYLLVTIGYLPFVLFVEPVAAGCPECPANPFLVDANLSLVESWSDGLSAVGIGLLLAVLARIWHRTRAAPPRHRAMTTPVMLAGGALSGMLTLLLALSLADASERTLDLVFYATLIPFGLVPLLFLLGLVRGRWVRGRGLGALVRRLAAGLERGEIRDALREALGDPTLEVAYWIPEREQFVDSEGHPARLPDPGSEQLATEVERHGRRIAAIIHDRALLEDLWHVRAAGAAAALALENERLEAELRAKVEELRASRSRLMSVGMRERRRLERDLHDGAQQRLVSLALNLRLARERLDEGSAEAEQLLDSSRDELDRALGELRELARGIHPAVLSDRGLGAAVEALAHRTPIPVELGSLPAQRLPEHVELAAYFVVAEALTNVAKYSQASHATIAVTRANGEVTVEVGDDGVGGADPALGSGLRGLTDRLETIEGALEVDSSPDRGTRLRARIPCP